MIDTQEQALAEARKRVLTRWPSARVLPGGCDTHPRLTLYAVFIGAANLKGGNGRRRKSGWKKSENEAFADADKREGK